MYKIPVHSLPTWVRTLVEYYGKIPSYDLIMLALALSSTAVSLIYFRHSVGRLIKGPRDVAVAGIRGVKGLQERSDR